MAQRKNGWPTVHRDLGDTLVVEYRPAGHRRLIREEVTAKDWKLFGYAALQFPMRAGWAKTAHEGAWVRMELAEKARKERQK